MLLEYLPPKNCLDLGNLHNNLARILKDNDFYHCALDRYEIAEKLYLKSVPHNHLYFPPTYINIGNVYCLKGKHPQDWKYHFKALNIRRKSFPINHLFVIEFALLINKLLEMEDKLVDN